MSDQSAENTAHCDVCDWLMTPKNDRADGHICRECLKDIQVGDRVAE